MWSCKSCSIEHIRDENAACNGLKKVLTALSLVPEENPKISREKSLPVRSSDRVHIKNIVLGGFCLAEHLCTAGTEQQMYLLFQEIKAEVW